MVPDGCQAPAIEIPWTEDLALTFTGSALGPMNGSLIAGEPEVVA